MFCIAIVVSTAYQLGDAFLSPQPTNTTGDSTKNLAYLPFDSFFLFCWSVTTMKCHGCIFPAEGAKRAAFMIFTNLSLGTSSGKYDLTDCLFLIASKTSIKFISLTNN